MSATIYLDNNATAPPAPAVLAAMQDCLRDGWGNPSSLHHVGAAAKERLAMGLSEQQARATVRFSLSRYNRAEEIDAVLEVLPDIVQPLSNGLQERLWPRNQRHRG